MNRAMQLQTSNNGGANLDSVIITELQEPFNGGPHDAHESQSIFEDIDSACSTPYVSAPSSPGRGPVGGFYYSAPASPMHFAINKSFNSSAQLPSSSLKDSHSFSFEFEFSGRFGSNGSGSIGPMSSADELFLNGKIRPMKLSTHLERPQVLAPLMDLEAEGEGEEEEDEGGEIVGFVRGRDIRLRDKSLRRRTRSMSPLRNTPVEWTENDDGDLITENDSKEGRTIEQNRQEESSETTTPSVSGSSSRSSSAGRNSKRWIFLKEFLYRSKSEGSSNHKFWSNISFSSAKEKKSTANQTSTSSSTKHKAHLPLPQMVKGENGKSPAKKPSSGKPTNGVGKRRIPVSPHELHYTKNRAQAEELRKKTFLPYRQGLLGCLGFSSKGFGAVNGFARALNSVSSR